MIRNLVAVILAIAVLGQLGWMFTRPIPEPTRRPERPIADAVLPVQLESIGGETSGGDSATDLAAADPTGDEFPSNVDGELETDTDSERIIVGNSDAMTPTTFDNLIEFQSMDGIQTEMSETDLFAGDLRSDRLMQAEKNSQGAGPITTDGWLFPGVMSEWEKKVSGSAAVPQRVAKQILQSTVRVVTGQAEGSGVLMRRHDGYFDVLTADHLLGDAAGIIVDLVSSPASSAAKDLQYDRTERSIQILHRDAAVDLAMLRVHTPIDVDGSDVTLTTMRSAEFVGRDVLICDISESDAPSVRSVPVTASESVRRNETATAVEFLKLSIASKPGMSGSGMYDTAGYLIGIASGNAGGLAHYIGPDELRDCLARWQK